MKRKGFTLIELMVSISVLALISAAGMGIFFRSIRDSSKSELTKSIDDRSRVIIASLTRYLREGQITNLDSYTRQDCLVGVVTGTNLTVRGFDGLISQITLNSGQLASVSASGSQIYNPETGFTITNINASTPLFSWTCQAGVSDTITVSMKMLMNGDATTGTVSKDYIFNIILRNTGQ